ncbi:TonB-dependent receptor [Sphingomonas solaris]|uniref:TonB-dependent receptor n=1 Tax=Alterirhizorhabdus solaris TaxID=2529389 RepID=UPI0013969E8B|nr:TonB-dependent receptor [Sphingomonas solaris]
MPRADRAACAVAIACAVASPAEAAARRIAISIPAGALGNAIATLGGQTGVSIGTVDPVLSNLPVRRLRGTMSVDQALARLLRGLPARAERIDATSWRIVRAARPAKPVTPRLHAPDMRSAGSSPTVDIIVTASKRDTVLSDYPGTAYLLDGQELARRGASGTDAIIARLPTVESTALGPGRNKLFIRGVADSSFNGPSQATIGEYLGDVRLNYSAPDPNLTLVDIGSVEVLEGPQGTLYGAATLGGVLRIVPNAPQLASFAVAVTGGVAATAHGANGGDLSAVVNVPIVPDVVGLRVVAYRAIDGGYIDDPGRGLTNINRTATRGGRATMRVRPGGGWTVDVGGAYQASNSDDGQYATRDVGPLARRSRIAQPFDNDYALASVAATTDFGATTFRASAGMVAQNLDSRFDFTPANGPLTLFEEANRIRLLSGEVSLARRGTDGVGWIVGVSALHNEERLTRNLGAAAAPARILGVRNETTNASGFVEAGVRLAGRLVATGGVRLDFAHLVGAGLSDIAVAIKENRRNELSLLPSIALTWRLTDRTTLFARYQEGFRPGGLSVSGTNGTTVERFAGDSLKMIEAGARFPDLLGSGIAGTTTLSYAHWENIQADLVDAGGLPFTANVGTGRIIGLEASLSRRLIAGVRGEAAVFVNKSRLTRPAAFLMAGDDPALPNVAKAGGRASLMLDRPLSGRLTLPGDATLRYVGHSRLGVGPLLGIVQGHYVDTSAVARIGTARFGVTATLSNLLDARGDRFALGNPFDVASGRQTVPLRPRTIRIGFDARF